MHKIFLIPNTLGATGIDAVIPLGVQNSAKALRYFFVENIRTARRYLKKIDKSFPIDDCHFFEINKHTAPEDINRYFSELSADAGIISESGAPAIADPGAYIVAIAHSKGWQVIPLVGPSSVLLALMASGMNGQNFAFVGYLPKNKALRQKKLKVLEAVSRKLQQTQIFIETPYRNQALFETILETCNSNTRLCVAGEITTGKENITTLSIAEWKKRKPDIHKKNVIFLIDNIVQETRV